MSLTTKRIITIAGLILFYLPFRFLGDYVAELDLPVWVAYPVYAILGGTYIFIAWKTIQRLKG